ncbi:Membrane protein involved in the export of O-antigen and teichoic acid [Tangfeifania diversioriginum]|uniref:Membrane protein involved in the export of O-antigen and teichoic acid n=1 Tax=Tangfeifania diversioriginum TaxID=1168035 RepID=A0A1M6MIT3_9BACT|nr:flippase [Tangfeifania diversioriginum]SHJ83193.1 Membrane protein involved in the export of O-antigen and teichoic acid [Tangfeifania diversioriginum]
MIKRFIIYGRKRLLKLDEHTLEVVRKSSASTVAKVAGMAIGLLVSVFLGRTIGAEGLGIINLSNRVVNILLVVGLLGMRQVIIKEVAITHNKKDFAHIGNVMHTAYWLNGGITLVLSVILIFLSPWLANTVFNEPRLQYPLMIALVVMTPQVFSRIFSSGLVGYRKIWQSNLVEQTLSIAITGILLVILWLLKREITVNIVAVCYAIGRAGVTISVGLYWHKLYKFKAKRIFIPKPLLKTSIPLLGSTLAAIVVSNADAIMLGWLGTTKEVGLYSVAARLALLTSFFLQVTNASVSPKIAALYESGKMMELEKMVQRVTKGLGLFGLMQVVVFIGAGKFILGIWGAEFTSAYWVLIILGLGQLVNIGTGAVGLLLIMCGYEKTQSHIAVISMLLNLLLNFVLIKYFGATGVAIATALTIAGVNIARVYFVKKKLGIITIPINILNKK